MLTENDRSVQIELSSPAKKALERLRARGFSAYVVGGCVRDSLLGKKAQDWDITTSALPEETQVVFSDCSTYATGIQHGTVTVVLDGVPLEVTTFRVDGEYSDHRRPDSVAFTRSLKEYLRRRDFTVNALAYNPEEGLWDFFAGREDLHNRCLRCVGDADTRFQEDALRILRGLRFSATLGFSLEENTATAIHRNCGRLSHIAAERIRVEWEKLLRGEWFRPILTEYADVVRVFLPEICPEEYPAEQWREVVKALTPVEPQGNFRFAMLLWQTGENLSVEERVVRGENILRRLKYPREAIAEITCFLQNGTIHLPQTAAQGCRFLHTFGAERGLALLRFRESLTPHAAKKSRALCEALLRTGACYQLSQLAISGEDLLRLGISRGKTVGRILNALLELVMEGDLPNQAEVLLDAAKGYLQ